MIIIIGILFLVSLNTLEAQFKFDPALKWKTIESKHLVVHYPQGEDSLANRVVLKGEWFFQRLRDAFKYSPADKIQLVVDTSSDIVFGAATPFPNLALYVNPTQTSLGLGHFDDWLDLIIAHEMTHAVDLDKVGGLPATLRTLLGRLYFPGALGPQWLTEGLATYFETELTGYGRRIDPYHDMILRMAFLEDRVNSQDQNNLFLVRWPGGSSFYVYGQSLYSYLAERYYPGAIINFRNDYTSNVFPLGINDAMKSATADGRHKVYGDWKVTMQHRYEKQAKSIRKLAQLRHFILP